jgi:hypothetical protein
VTLTGLVDLFCTDPTLSASIEDARARRLPALDLTSPPSMRPFVAAALAASTDHGGADRPVLVVTSTYREAEDVTAALQSLAGEDAVAYYPRLGDAPARAAQPALGHRRPSAGGAPPAGRQRRAAAAPDPRRPRPQRAPAAGEGPGRPAARARGGR